MRQNGMILFTPFTLKPPAVVYEELIILSPGVLDCRSSHCDGPWSPLVTELKGDASSVNTPRWNIMAIASSYPKTLIRSEPLIVGNQQEVKSDITPPFFSPLVGVMLTCILVLPSHSADPASFKRISPGSSCGEQIEYESPHYYICSAVF